MTTLCDAAKDQARWIWADLEAARWLQCKIGEESITDFFVLQLTGRSDGSYTIRSFNCRQEAVSGADWELWLTGPSGKWFGLRVQAKIISLNSQYYAQLHHKKTQTDILVIDAAKHHATPLYCLYSYWRDPEAGMLSWPCNLTPVEWRLLGVSILGVPAVRTLKATGENSLIAVAPSLMPLHCLFCCQHDAPGDLPTRARAFAQSRGYGGDTPPEL